MRGTIYYKKWQHMPWWSRLHHIKQLSIVEGYNEKFALFGHMIDYVDETWQTFEKLTKKPTQHWDDPMIKMSEYDKTKFEFYKRLMAAFPNLAYVVQEQVLHNDPQNWRRPYNPFLPFFTHFYRHLRRGLSPEDATNETIKTFRHRFDRQYAQLEATEIVAEDNNGKSLMDFLALQKVKESYFKTKRVIRDNEMLDILRGKNFKYDDDYEPNYEVINENQFRAHVQERELTPDKVLSPEVAQREKKDITSFIARSKGLLWRYFDEVVKHDKVAGMSNQEVQLMLFNTPAALERHFGPFAAKLVDKGVYLSAMGDPMFDRVTDKDFERRVMKKPELVQFALMLMDLNYGSLHQQQMERQANALNDKIIEVNAQSVSAIQRMNEDNLRELADKLKLSKSETDDLLGFVYYEQHEREKRIIREPISKAVMDINGFLEDRNRRIDWANDFKESIFERNIRLQAEWLKEQLVYTRTTQRQRLELTKRLTEAIRSLRRTRFQFDKTALQKASRIFFLEHMNIDFGKEDVDIERLEEYFNIPQDVFVRDPREDHEYQRSKKATQKTMLVIDAEDPLRSGSHDPIEEYQADEAVWDAKRFRPELKSNSERAKGAAVNRGYYEALQRTEAEMIQYFKDHPNPNDTGKDPMLMFLKTRNERINAKKAIKTAENKALKEKKRIKAAKAAAKA